LLALSIFYLSGCFADEGNVDCWPELLELEVQVDGTFDTMDFDEGSMLVARENLRKRLENCPGDTSLFYVPRDDRDLETTFALLSIAIVADDDEAVREIASRLTSYVGEVPTNLFYSGRYLELAAFLEAENSLRILLEDNLAPGIEQSQFIDDALLAARANTESGLRSLGLLVKAGGNVHVEIADGHTLIELAARHGALRKVQCLYMLGAPLPMYRNEWLSERSVFTSREAIEETATFLSATKPSVPKEISELCTFH